MKPAVCLALGMMLVAVMSGCKRRSTQTSMLPIPDAGSVSQVLKDFQMQDILDGTKNMMVESPEGRISEQKREADVDKPHITFYKNGAVSSVLDAPQGRVGLDSHEVLAWGGVTVVTPDSSTLTTEHLRYNPKNKHLMTDAPVHIVKPDSITDGIGMDAEPDLSNVRIGHQKAHILSTHG